MREVVAATRLGQKNLARSLLKQIDQQDPQNEQALLWSAALAESPDEATAYLQRVLEINPRNQQAINVLAMHRLNPAAARAATPAPAGKAPEPRLPPREPEAPEPVSGMLALAAEPAEAWPPEPLSAPAGKPALAVPPTAAASRVVHFHELLKRSWHCPVCEAQSPTMQRKCARCGALLALDDLDALADSRGVDEKLLHRAVDQWKRHVTAEPSFEGWLNLARVYFNLNRSAEALPCLREACELRPSETALQLLASRLAQRRLVLAVDDSMTLRRILGIMLERHGHRVLTAADGMQALALLNDQVPDLILLDITMPRMDGYQVCKVIKQNPYTKHIPVVMLSGNDGFFDKIKGKLAGATDYITKPFEEEALAAAVGKHLKASVGPGH